MRQRLANWSETLKRQAAGLASSIVQTWHAKGPKAKPSAAPVPQRRSLVKNRPQSLEQRYELLDHEELGDEVFLKLKARIFEATNGRRAGLSSPGFLKEAGRIAPGRPYFYVKPMNAKGWLFERSGKGWVVTQAEKIVGRDLFLRDETPADVVSLYMARDKVVLPRVQSSAFGGDLLAFSVYEHKLMHQIGCAP